MNIITMASRKGGAGKSTLTAHLAAFAQQAGHRCVVIDADPQGSLSLWHSLRADGYYRDLVYISSGYCQHNSPEFSESLSP